MTATRRNSALFFAAVFAVTLGLRLCHWHVLWADEDYHMAAGMQALAGKVLYRDLWYDKPPLTAWLYAAIGGFPGWPLRLFDAVYILAICAAAWRFARDLWGRPQAFAAAGLLGFFLNFDFPSAVIPLQPDLLLMLPHIAAVHCAWRRRPFAAGLWCGVAMFIHTKGVFVLAMCALLAWRSLPMLGAGFLIPNVAALAVLAACGAVPDYFRQVWQWGLAYAASSPEPHPWANGLRRTLDWCGFHSALLLAAGCFWWRNRKREHVWLLGWVLVSFVGVALGARFSPRYFLLLLPPLVLACGKLPTRRAIAGLGIALLLIPALRFGPRYFALAGWADTALDRDSQAAAALVNARKQAGDTLMVWGYRPGIFVYTRMPAASRFWDSQPLTGVPADRHLQETLAILPEWAARNRVEFAAAGRPVFLVDSLSLSNPRLAIGLYPELRAWLAGYQLVARTPLSLVYQRNRNSAPR